MPSKRRCGRSPPSNRRSWRSPPSRRGPRSSLRKLGRSPPSRRGGRSLPSKRRCGRSPLSNRRSWRSPPSRRGPRSSLRKLGRSLSKRRCGRSPPSKRRSWRSPPSRRGPRSSLRKLGRSPPSRRGVAEGSRRAGRPPEEDLGLKGGMANSRQDKLRRNCACTTAALSAPGLQRWQEKRARQALHKKFCPSVLLGAGSIHFFVGRSGLGALKKTVAQGFQIDHPQAAVLHLDGTGSLQSGQSLIHPLARQPYQIGQFLLRNA